MRLIDIEPFETAKDVSTCEITVWRNGDGYADVATMNTKDIPAVDAVEVVRCRECLYWQDNNGGYPHEECRWGKGETPDADDFCSYGERKGDDEQT